jgi:hypothetical protein
MKKLLLLVLLTSMFGTAHATRSRMNSLGQENNQGSFYLMDNRNFFRNAASAAKMRNFMVAELGDGSTIPNAPGANVEGGYFGEFNSDMAYGVYLGKANVLTDAYAGVIEANTGWEFLTAADSNPVNLFLAGGSDMKWGINLNFGMSNDETATDRKYQTLGVGAGIETSGGLQVYVNYPFSNKSEGTISTGTTAGDAGDELKSTGLQVGLIYALNAETSLWAQYTMDNAEVNQGSTAANGVSGNAEVDGTGFVIGIGRIYELSPTARFNFDLSYNMNEVEVKNGGGKTKGTGLPINVGLEADAAEWLILRASVKQNFLLGETENTAGKKTSLPRDTSVAIGGTLHFGKLKIDGNLGSDGAYLFDSSAFFAQAAATYMF